MSISKEVVIKGITWRKVRVRLMAGYKLPIKESLYGKGTALYASAKGEVRLIKDDGSFFYPYRSDKKIKAYRNIEVTLSNGNRCCYLAHILVAIEWVSAPPTKRHQVNHKDGVRDNNHPSNLEWVTAAQNMQHAVDTKLK